MSEYGRRVQFPQGSVEVRLTFPDGFPERLVESVNQQCSVFLKEIARIAQYEQHRAVPLEEHTGEDKVFNDLETGLGSIMFGGQKLES